jgi:hypothetical protein
MLRTARRLSAHVALLIEHATVPKVLVTLGVTTATILSITGREQPAVVISVLTNIIWIWE